MTSKNIIVCCDGTWNSPTQTDGGEPAPTNVRKLYAAVDDEADPARPRVPGDTLQIRWYDEGVGAALGFWGKLLNFLGTLLAGAWGGKLNAQAKLGVIIEGATGLGIAQNIREAYLWLSQVYQPGDRIFLFGFSRGAFQVRSLSGLLFHCGLLKPEFSGFAPELFKLYEKERKRRQQDDTRPRWQIDQNIAKLKTDGLIHDPEQFRIHFLGVWDTVAALGLPMWGWSFELFGIRTKYHDTTLVPIIEHAYHAVAMDEERSSFMPVLLRRPAYWDGKAFEQKWFRGAHADIGGGYAGFGPQKIALSDIALRWMMKKAQAAGLRYRSPVVEPTYSEVDAPLHSEVASKPAYVLSGTWPRMFPVAAQPYDPPAPELGDWHDSVGERERAITGWGERERLARLGASQGWCRPQPDPRERGWRDLEPNEKSAPVEIFSDRAWNPTGIILRAGLPYRFHAEGGWIDRDPPTCSPEGISTWRILQKNLLSLRFWACWAKRYFSAPWMQLIGMVNHPTDWQRRTLPAWMLPWFVLVKEPRELAKRQFPIGVDSVFIPAKTGPLYCFANDMWIFYGNNAGSVRLTVERLSNTGVKAEPPQTTDRLLPVLLAPLGAALGIGMTLLILAVAATAIWYTAKKALA
ncbi:MAG: DUF2235 domain-containing protein [Rhodocyclales bacterium]|nr:DUF2235 domain-containing protein [Rhodocyclales bacterium]